MTCLIVRYRESGGDAGRIARYRKGFLERLARESGKKGDPHWISVRIEVIRRLGGCRRIGERGCATMNACASTVVRSARRRHKLLDGEPLHSGPAEADGARSHAAPIGSRRLAAESRGVLAGRFEASGEHRCGLHDARIRR